MQDMISITKQFGFEMAHQLPNHEGACRNIHGHSYVLWVTVSGVPLTKKEHPNEGMIIDFKELKQIVHKAIIDDFDHALVLSKSSLHQIKDTKLILMDSVPTTENLLLEFATRLQRLLPGDVHLKKLRLQETPSSFGEWEAA